MVGWSELLKVRVMQRVSGAAEFYVAMGRISTVPGAVPRAATAGTPMSVNLIYILQLQDGVG